MKKLSFLERLTGAVKTDKYDDVLGEDHEFGQDDELEAGSHDDTDSWQAGEDEHVEQDGELPVDMYQTPDAIVIRALVAGVTPDDLDIGITRDMVTIRGKREEYREAGSDDYYHKELFWGSFSRTLVLPEEVVIDEADAQEKHGLLEIRLPKVDKGRSAKLKVKPHFQKN